MEMGRGRREGGSEGEEEGGRREEERGRKEGGRKEGEGTEAGKELRTTRRREEG